MQLYWLAIVALGVGTFANASTSTETIETNRTRLGFQAGMAFSSVAAPRDITPSNRTGLAAGVNLEIPIVSFFSIQPEALFTQRGSNLAAAGNVQFTVKYNSLEFPVFAKLKVPGPISPFLVAGPVAILNLSKSVEATSPGGATSIGFNPKTIDLDFAVGGGIDLSSFFATLRYSVGISNLDQTSSEWKSRGVYVLAGLRI